MGRPCTSPGVAALPLLNFAPILIPQVRHYRYYVALDASILCNDPPLCTGRLGDQDGEPLKHRTNAFIRIPIV
jgi:hypothetical protein